MMILNALMTATYNKSSNSFFYIAQLNQSHFPVFPVNLN